jgi:hypothetical protein
VTDKFVAAVVVLAGLHLVGLAVAAFAAPAAASRFLLGLASSAPVHYAELGVRFIVGGALLRHAPHMAMPGVFTVVGWVLVITTAVLLAVPWRWHRRFAERFVPPVVRHTRLLGVASFVLGSLVLAASV